MTATGFAVTLIVVVLGGLCAALYLSTRGGSAGPVAIAKTGQPTNKQNDAEKIIAAMDPWTLACAVGAENGSIGTSMGFDMWFEIAAKNFAPKVMTKTNSSFNAVKKALRAYVDANQHLDYAIVLKTVTAARNLPQAVVLGPGESMEVTLTSQ